MTLTIEKLSTAKVGKVWVLQSNVRPENKLTVTKTSAWSFSVSSSLNKSTRTLSGGDEKFVLRHYGECKIILGGN
jgi:hypothetical protein